MRSCLPRIASALALVACVSLLTDSASWAAEGPSCTRRFAALIEDEAHLLLSQKRAAQWERYHALLAKEITAESSPLLLRRKVRAWANDMVDAYSDLEPAFPKRDFQEFLEADLATLPPGTSGSMGEFMEKSYARFIAKYRVESVELLERAQKFKDYGRALAARCGPVPECYSAELVRLPGWITDTVKGSCLALSPQAVRDLARDLGVSLAVMGTYFGTQTSGQMKDFPFAFLINGVFWSTAFAEMSCRKAVAAAPTLPFARSLSDAKMPTWGQQVVKSVKEEVADWRWYPAMAATSVGLAYWFDVLNDRDRPADYYGWKWSFSVLYNSTTGPVRRVLLVDPLFKRAFPSLGRWVSEQVAAGKLGEIMVRTTSSGTDYGLRYQEWIFWGLLYDRYMESVMGNGRPK